MQKLIVLLFVCSTLAITCAFPQKVELTPEQEAQLDSKAKEALSRLENINIEQLLNRKRVIASHLRCALDEGPCDPVGKNIKVLIPFGLKDKCSSCTEAQRAKVFKVAKAIKQDHADYYTRILDKYFDGAEPEALKDI